MPGNDPVTLPFFWLGKDAEAADVVVEYYPPVPLIVVDDSEGIDE